MKNVHKLNAVQRSDIGTQMAIDESARPFRRVLALIKSTHVDLGK